MGNSPAKEEKPAPKHPEETKEEAIVSTQLAKLREDLVAVVDTALGAVKAKMMERFDPDNQMVSFNADTLLSAVLE